MKPFAIALLPALLLASQSALAKPPPSPLALSCLGCHQPAVDSAEMPALDKLSREQIEASLKSARDTPQPGSIMARFAAKMSDEQMRALATELGKGGNP